MHGKYTESDLEIQAAIAATEEGDGCSICAELENLLQKRHTLGAAGSPIGIALEYIARGWAVVPIPYRCKRPIIKEWEKLLITEDTAPQYFNCEAQNIGVRLGERSGDLADADLDSHEAIARRPISCSRHSALAGLRSRVAIGFICPAFGKPNTKPQSNSSSPVARAKTARSR
jgi:hypothetical protein